MSTIQKPSTLYTNRYFKNFLLRNRSIQLLLALFLVIGVGFYFSKALVIITAAVFLEVFLSFWIRRNWWNRVATVPVVSDLESKTLSALFFLTGVWTLSIGMVIQSEPQSLEVAFFIATSFVYFLALLHVEFIKVVQVLSRNLSIRMPLSSQEDPRADPLLINHKVRSEIEIVQLVKKASHENKKIRVIGSRNSARLYREAPGDAQGFIQIDVYNSYAETVHVDTLNKTITVQAGTTQRSLVHQLKKLGWALNTINGSHLLSVGGTVATGSFSASRYPYGNAVLSLTVVEATGEVITVDRQKNADVFGAYLCSNGLLGVVSTITLQCVDEFYVRGKGSKLTFDEMVNLKDEKGSSFLKDWDYIVCEWYPILSQVVCRLSVQIPPHEYDSTSTKKQSSVGPSESYVGQLLTLVGNHFPILNRVVTGLYLNYLGTDFGDGIWIDRICADPRLDTAFHPLDFIEVILSEKNYRPFMLELKEYYLKNPEEMPYGPVITDWIAGDKDVWLGKNSTTETSEDQWFAALTFMRQHVETKSADAVFKGPIEIAKKHHGRMHWGKSPWLFTAQEIEKTLPQGNFEKFLKLRSVKDPTGIFLNDYFEKMIR